MRKMRQSIAALISLVQFISLLLLVLIQPSFSTPSPSIISFEMIPDGQDRFVKEGTTFNITCRLTETNYNKGGIDDYTITWENPSEFIENEIRPISNKTVEHHDRQVSTVGPPFNITITSTLTVYNATSKETGLYKCISRRRDITRPVLGQHIYVNDGKSLITIPTYKTNLTFLQMEEASNVTVERMDVDEGTDVIIPCRGTQPDVNISFSHRTFSSANPISLVNHSSNMNTQDLYREANSRYLVKDAYLNRPAQLTVINARPSDSGIYKCKGSNGTTISEINVLLIVKGIDLAMVGGNQEIEEGSNVTLVCTYFYDANPSTTKPVWKYGKRYGKLVKLKLIGDNLAYDRWNLSAKISHDYFMNEFYRSTLQLFKVSSSNLENNYFDFCPSSESDDVIRNRNREVAIRFKSEYKDVEIVDIETGRERNLTCANEIIGHYYNIQWFKDNELLNMTGKRYVWQQNQLILNGDPGNDGTYQCTYEDRNGDEKRRTFVVKTKSRNPMTIIISVTIVIAILFTAVGLWWFFRNSRRKLFPDADKLLKGINRDFDFLPKDEALYAQQPYDKRWEFPRNRLKIGKQIGAGCFGCVSIGEAIGIKKEPMSEPVTTVAVKMIKSRNVLLDANRELESLVAELKILIYLGPHLNVVSLLGACTKHIAKGDFLLILDYCPFGNLKSFLNDPNHEFNRALIDEGYVEAYFQMESNKCSDYLPMCANEDRNPPPLEINQDNVVSSTSDHDVQLHTDGDYIPPSGPPTFDWQTKPAGDVTNKVTYSIRDLISWSWQITRGMQHLANKKVVHGDLAARNVLLADNGVVKVADFGLAHRTYYKDYVHKEEKRPLPVKWMAVESLTNGKFTSQSDVWSYGVVLWELFSLGQIPYPGIEGRQMLNELKSGYRMDKPTDAPDFIGDIMKSCWQTEPKERPTFDQLENNLFNYVHSYARSYYLQLGVKNYC